MALTYEQLVALIAQDVTSKTVEDKVTAPELGNVLTETAAYAKAIADAAGGGGGRFGIEDTNTNAPATGREVTLNNKPMKFDAVSKFTINGPLGYSEIDPGQGGYFWINDGGDYFGIEELNGRSVFFTFQQARISPLGLAIVIRFDNNLQVSLEEVNIDTDQYVYAYTEAIADQFGFPNSVYVYDREAVTYSLDVASGNAENGDNVLVIRQDGNIVKMQASDLQGGGTTAQSAFTAGRRVNLTDDGEGGDLSGIEFSNTNLNTEFGTYASYYYQYGSRIAQSVNWNGTGTDSYSLIEMMGGDVSNGFTLQSVFNGGAGGQRNASLFISSRPDSSNVSMTVSQSGKRAAVNVLQERSPEIEDGIENKGIKYIDNYGVNLSTNSEDDDRYLVDYGTVKALIAAGGGVGTLQQVLEAGAIAGLEPGSNIFMGVQTSGEDGVNGLSIDQNSATLLGAGFDLQMRADVARFRYNGTDILNMYEDGVITNLMLSYNGVWDQENLNLMTGSVIPSADRVYQMIGERIGLIEFQDLIDNQKDEDGEPDAVVVFASMGMHIQTKETFEIAWRPSGDDPIETSFMINGQGASLNNRKFILGNRGKHDFTYDGAASATITHGLGQMPASVSISLQNTEIPGVASYQWTYDDATITIYFDAMPNDSNSNAIHWQVFA